ncbi:ribonuclease H-like domain-containing protein [Tanacetum coccineum]
MFLSQKKYALKLLKQAYMLNCNPTRTLVDTKSKLGPKGNMSYMHDHWETHLAALKWILCYVQGTLKFGLQLHESSGSSQVANSDADWVVCPATSRSTSGIVYFWETIFYHGLLSDNTLFHVLVLKPNIRTLLTLLLRQDGETGLEIDTMWSYCFTSIVNPG